MRVVGGTCLARPDIMQRYIAFLSGLPVGPGTVSQETLRTLFIKLGFLNVESHGTSGNVAFETSPVGVVNALEAQISRHLKRSIGGPIWTFIRTPAELADIEANVPFDHAEGSSVFVVLLTEHLDERTERMLSVRRTQSDILRPHGREIYWLRQVDDGGASPLAIADMIAAHATLRSLTTIRNLAQKYAPAHRPASADTTASERSRL